MESLLFTLDVFFMAALVWAIFKAERKAPQFRDLGFFAYRDIDRTPDSSQKDSPDA